jgi:hypothetical protein
LYSKYRMLGQTHSAILARLGHRIAGRCRIGE